MHNFHLVGVLHLPPLPGAVNYEGAPVRAIAEAAAEDALILQNAGFTAVMIQDASDNPQPTLLNTATVAAMAAIGVIVKAHTTISLGVVAGHNDGPASVAIAHAIGAEFVRVKVLTGVSLGPTGWMEGCSLQVAQMKRLLGNTAQVWADAHEATSLALAGDVAWAADQALGFGGADKIIVTRDSGVLDAIDDIARVKAAVGSDVDVLIGGRVTGATLGSALRASNGAILGSVLKTGQGYDARIDEAVAVSLGSEYRDWLATTNTSSTTV
jgi:membrane complex biogenesis BtpA family protein